MANPHRDMPVRSQLDRITGISAFGAPFRHQQADVRCGCSVRYLGLSGSPWSATPGLALEDRHEVTHATRLELLDHVW